ncbi:cysteine synthase [Candidatus Hydrogenisulfobacillus filiaventi]|uniref:Cysteine synthase n=1 Tax=Candidatus Hydrogenisulfobacillus filiaventi TaxID=2707344 RepID=A0A6F8ZGI9_9FIRM|nr:cysteine synthase A [Bacillota bacterium]CAB1128783.1 cysteine synthase [Candidatus Hydrogenisulfobacillus filiaventi]
MADITALIGNTPLVRLQELSERTGIEVWAKLEMFNPGGSVKDRTAWALIRDAEARGRLGPGTVLIEATSGNTGIALAMVAAARGLRLRLCMPAGQSEERRQLFWAYGAQLEETPREEGTPGAIRRARELEAELPGALWLRQHENPANPRVHEETTGPEIWRQTGGRVDLVVAGVGTGGTITGVGRFLKRCRPAVRLVAVEPAASAVLSGRPRGPHRIQGIGAGFVPAVLDTGLLDEVVAVEDEAAWEAARRLARREGILAGLSSGAAYVAAERVLNRDPRPGSVCVVIFPDSGERYLSLGLYRPSPE